MNTPFKILLTQLQLDNVQLYKDAVLDKLEVDKNQMAYHFYFTLETLLEPKDVVLFYSRLIEHFKNIKDVREVRFTTNLRQINPNLDISYYFRVVKELLFLYDQSFRALDAHEVNFNKKELFIDIKDEQEKESIERRFKHAVEGMFRAIGLNVAFNVYLSENGKSTLEDIDKVKESLNNEFKDQLVVEQKNNEQIIEKTDKKNNFKTGNYRPRRGTFTETVVGNPIKGSSEAISHIPITQEELTASKVEYVIEGFIFSCESRKTARGLHMIDFAITDYNDSISVKVFVKEEEQIPFYNAVFKKGNYIKLKGNPKYDEYRKEVVLFSNSGEVLSNPNQAKKKVDQGYKGEKRIEFHLHTSMSQMDSVTPITKYIDRAIEYGHEAIALTDHHVMYALPDMYNATKKKNIKPLYGVEINLVDDNAEIAFRPSHLSLKDATYVVFDLETTGFSVNHDSIIELAAVKVKNGNIVDEYSSYCNPHRKLSSKTIQITNIRDADLFGAPEIPEVLEKFKRFSEGAILVAHNARFDMSHIYAAFDKFGLGECTNPVIDTLDYARNRFSDDLKRFNLKALCKFFKVDLTQHHRAIYDAKATAEVFLHLLRDMEKAGVMYHDEINSMIEPSEAYKYQIPKHATLIAKNEKGLKNLFKIVSKSHTDHFYKEPRVVRRYLTDHRSDVFVGSGCVEGEVFKTALEKTPEELLKVCQFYDYLEVQPPEVYAHLVYTSGQVEMTDHIKEAIKSIIRAGNQLNIPVIASSDAHHLDPEDKVYREIYIDTPSTGGGLHPLSRPDIENVQSMHFRTTDEMFRDFDFLPEDVAYDIIIKNPKKLADQIDKIKAIKDELFTPKDDFLKDKGIPSIDAKLKEMCTVYAEAQYGSPLPQLVQDRLDKELNSIIKHGFSVIYYISHMLVKKSLDDGYVVGSRGSVGSSFVATVMEITEVNPLSPHYYCPTCHFSSFKMNEDEKSRYGIKEIETSLQAHLDLVESGFDLPDAICPKCQTDLKKDGHDIPFETFLGFEGDKVPDIDLNFSGEYQAIAHQYCQEVFGVDFAFRAGTIGTVAEKTAFGYVRGYYEKRGVLKREPEIRRIATECQGVKRSTGQHPGGIIVVPDYMDIYDITPIQYPADNTENSFRTTHFDFHSIHDNLLKLDILGHDDPTILRYLEDITGIKPTDVPIDDPKVYQLFCSTESLGVTPQQIGSVVGSYGVPEFGTFFVRSMLEETRPTTFGELVKISGLSHGTDVWNTNAQDLVNGANPEFGKVEFKEVIGCRDDIMVYLMYHGLEPKLAFDIMEFVRKGKAKGDPDKWAKYIEEMRKRDIPEWYIWSCGRIQYMFPKAHATAYVLMAIRIAWFKVNMPIHYYAAYFSKRADTFDVTVLAGGSGAIRRKIETINNKGYEATLQEKALLTTLELALEMTERGMYFKQVDLELSHSSEFVITEDQLGLIIPFLAIDGLGANVASSIVRAREEKEFFSKEDLAKRTSVSKTLIERLTDIGTLKNLNESDQISLFDEFLYKS